MAIAGVPGSDFFRSIASDEARAGHGLLAKELHSAAIAAEDEPQSQAPEHVGDPGTALRACRSLLQVRTDDRFDIELNRLVFASHQVPPGCRRDCSHPRYQEYPITKHDSGAIRYHETTMIEMLSPDGAQVPSARRPRSLRRRRKRDLRALVTGAALVIGVAWTIILGVGVFVR